MRKASNDHSDRSSPIQEDFLKERHYKIPPNDIWRDDALSRESMAQSLTNFIEHQTNSLVVSLHGDWGTGKTFFLERWHASLTKNDFEAIYFNAWEDDFCSDPLVAIIGQISEKLETNDNYKCEVKKVMKIARSLLKQILNNAVEKHVGISFKELSNASKNRALASYRKQRKGKDLLKDSLRKMSKKVMSETGHPLVFIIDELDRCRPTFAIELLERVKHIFDIPNMVFVLGVNRDELCKSIQSVYGEIKADVYFRRFFDWGFTLPEGNKQTFCGHLIKQYQLEKIFETSDENNMLASFPGLFKRVDLSLRDMDYCMRSIVFFGKKPNEHLFAMCLFPALILSILRLKTPVLYREFISGRCPVNEVLDYIDEQVVNKIQNGNWLVEEQLLLSEVIFYKWNSLINLDDDDAFNELLRWHPGEKLISQKFSKKTRESNDQCIEKLHNIADKWYKKKSDDIGYGHRFFEFAQSLELSDVPTESSTDEAETTQK